MATTACAKPTDVAELAYALDSKFGFTHVSDFRQLTQITISYRYLLVIIHFCPLPPKNRSRATKLGQKLAQQVTKAVPRAAEGHATKRFPATRLPNRRRPNLLPGETAPRSTLHPRRRGAQTPGGYWPSHRLSHGPSPAILRATSCSHGSSRATSERTRSEPDLLCFSGLAGMALS
jgi:hypothetical protein